MIRNVELTDENSRHGESWKLINKITGRKSAKRGVLKGISREDRISKWQQYFSQLLGNEPVVERDPDEVIPTILENLNIQTDLLTIDEYMAVKNKLILGKSTDPNDIPPDLLKLCDVDDINLKIAN